jgi:hypothetical protein
LLLVLLVLLVSVSAATAQETIDPELTEQMVNLEAVTVTLRDLPVLQPVERQFPTRQETIDYLRDLYAREFPPEEFARLQRFYVALDLLDADIELQEVFLNLLGSQVAGFYDSDTQIMNVLPVVGDDPGTSLSVTEQVIYVHEFTHALQDQHFDLNALLDTPDAIDHPDRTLALTALVEGDATAVMTLYTQEVAARNPFAALSILVEGLQSGGLFLPPGIPDILVTELLFPYNQGLTFVITISEEDGWDQVNATYTDPPTTTEQIIHPEKYLAGEAALDVSLAAESTVLGDGWIVDWDTTLGEFYLREYLDTRLSSSQAAEAAAGWGGDHFRIFYDPATSATAWALKIVWDTAADGEEFAAHYARFTDARFDAADDSDGCWQDDDSALCLIASATETLLVSAPTLEQAQALAAAG